MEISKSEKNKTKICLLPHQLVIQKHLPVCKYPFYVYWSMGSGKTIAGCVFMQSLLKGESALVVCDKSVTIQWTSEIKRVWE